MTALLTALSIPSPSEGVWHLGPLPLRAYAFAIILGVFAAIWTGERRWVARGGTHGQIGDLALWAVPAGLIGARLWHVATDHKLYFGEGGDPIGALEIWHGGLGIWGAIMGGLVGAWFYCRRHGILVRPLADALAPSLLLAQIIGRFGNYFNQELFGRPTDLPWGLEIDVAHRPSGYEQFTTFHPTFLYEALYIWRGGLGVWGAIALGAVGVLIACRRHGIKMLPMSDALAPGVLVAQAIGRWGNWFNQELFGKPTDLPWGLQIDPAYRPPGYEDFATFHPTYLYEFVWNLLAFAVIIWLDRRYRLGGGRVLALYVMGYTLGRGWIEMLRIDTVQMNNVLGLRLNVWTSIVLFVLATTYFVWAGMRGVTREEDVYVEGHGPEAEPTTDADTDSSAV